LESSPCFLPFLKDQLVDVTGVPVGKPGHRKLGYIDNSKWGDFCSPSSPQSGWVSSSARAARCARGLGVKEAELRPAVMAACRGLAGLRQPLRYPALRQLRALEMREVTLILIWAVQ